MVPSAIVVLDEIPLTPVGKLDRRALPEPARAPAEFRLPATEFEAVIAEIFCEVLGVEQVVRPFDRRSQGLLARIRIAACLEQVEPLRQALDELIGRENDRPRSG